MKYLVICSDCSAVPCVCRPLCRSWHGYPMQLQRAWHANYQDMRPKVLDRGEVERQAKKIYDEGWRQVSRRYRRIRKGHTTLELPREAEPFMRALRAVPRREETSN